MDVELVGGDSSTRSDGNEKENENRRNNSVFSPFSYNIIRPVFQPASHLTERETRRPAALDRPCTIVACMQCGTVQVGTAFQLVKTCFEQFRTG